ncbi:MAG: 8-oxoguanine DNA glycosylase [Oscillospiraceae bacterium]|jgi:N-glycosylase/DNA lyase|nr:8-oxoguanine DNA glycosylase [Oscillospiraceae bacterium]
MVIQSPWLDLTKIARSGQTFRWRWIGGSSYIIPALDRELHARQLSPDRVEFACRDDEWARVWARYFDLNTDYESIADSVDPDDAYLRAASAASRGLRMLRQELWETLVSFICSQNNNIPRITGMLNRLCEACGGFPCAERLREVGRGALSACGLGYRMEYLARAAEQFISDKPDTFLHTYGYEQARQYLLTYHGIGPKVADCVCLYGLGLVGAFPRDVWVKRVEARHYGGAFPVERYPDSAGILQLFMFWYEREREKPKPPP